LPPTLGPAVAGAARDAAVELFQGLVDDRVVDHTPAILRAAQDFIEDRLAGDLDAPTVARALHVSVRTLYRAFAEQGSSIMAYVRERRLDRARADLLSGTRAVSEIAARWHFADGSHFVKAYRKRFGETPTASRVSAGRSARTPGSTSRP
jgi:AraC-like DNA-binding protein